MCCSRCFPCYKRPVREDADKILYKTFDTSSYDYIGNSVSRTPRTIKKHIAGRATPEKICGIGLTLLHERLVTIYVL